MKNFSKIISSFFLIVFLLQIFSVLILLTLPIISNAADDNIYFYPQISIGENFKVGGKKEIVPTSIGQYIMSIYNYAISIVGIIAAVVIMIGGVMWITAGGNQSRITEAKAWISSSIIGLVLALSSFMILKTINPDLVKIKAITPTGIKNISTSAEETAEQYASRQTKICNATNEGQKCQTSLGGLGFCYSNICIQCKNINEPASNVGQCCYGLEWKCNCEEMCAGKVGIELIKCNLEDCNNLEKCTCYNEN